MAKKMNYNRACFQKKGYDLSDAGQDSRHQYHGKGHGTMFAKTKGGSPVKAYRNIQSIKECKKDIQDTLEKKRITEILKKYEWKETE